MAAREPSKEQVPPLSLDVIPSHRPVIENHNLPPYADINYSVLSLTTHPDIQFNDIYQFMIERRRPALREEQDERNVNSFRTMDRAVSHFQAGDVQDIKLAQIDTDVTYCTASVLASMKKQKYRVYICLYQDKPAHAHCQCPIGLAQCCSHVGGLLFALNDFNREVAIQQSTLSCTSKLSKWNVPRKLTMKPCPLRDLKLSKPTLEPEKPSRTVLEFDPRHTSDKMLDYNHYAEKMRELRSIFPNTGMAHLAIIPDSVPDFLEEEEVTTTKNEMEARLQQLIYTANTSIPATIDKELQEYVEKNTRQQRESELWLDLHKGRITSSRFGDVMASGPSPNSLIKELLNGSSLNKYSTLPPSVQWGIDMEQRAKVDYMAVMESFGTPIQIENTGLFLLQSAAFLGASCDGKVIDPSMPSECQEGVLEIKCPFSINGQKICEMEVLDILEKFPSFYMKTTEEGPELDKSHKYYAQVQGEMAVTGLPWCDFVVWTSAGKNNICSQRIQFDPEYVFNMLPKLQNFYFKFLCKN
ncbi:uncharacterized protein [Argopecten irradians]|uniref:uncharacterized protein n=1 Tax=Argopecten irradians TaxID=31199 RepID=UPI003716A869